MRANIASTSTIVLFLTAGAWAQTCTPHFEAVGLGTNGPVNSLIVTNDGLIAGGAFTSAGGVGAGLLARWDGSAWAALPGGIGGNAGDHVNVLTTYKGNLLAAGYFGMGGASANTVASLSVASWAGLVGGPAAGLSEVRCLVEHDNMLYVAGRFDAIGGVTVNKIARFDDSSWQALPGGGVVVGDSINAIAFFDPDGDGPLPASLIAAGQFTQIGTPGTVSASNIARWTGSGWEPLGSGVDGAVNTMTVFDEDGPGGNPPRLFVGGLFATAGGVTATNIARWDGDTWSAAGVANFQGLPGGTRGVTALAAYDDDGNGPDKPVLYAGGDFYRAGGFLFARGIARFNGIAWQTLGPAGQEGVSGGSVNTLAATDDGLYIGGSFTAAGGQSAPGIVRWSTCRHQLADIAIAGSGQPGHDGFITGEDFDLFVQAFFTGQRDAQGRLIADVATAGSADGYADGYITGEDFDMFIIAFFKGL